MKPDRLNPFIIGTLIFWKPFFLWCAFDVLNQHFPSVPAFGYWECFWLYAAWDCLRSSEVQNIRIVTAED